MEFMTKELASDGGIILLETCQVSELKSFVISKLAERGVTDVTKDDFYLLHNGKIVPDGEVTVRGENHVNTTVIRVVPRVLGGKGGFGSMLRAIGAQIEKTTNRDACRDLSGRRLRDLNEEEKLKKWYDRQAEREAEKVEAKKRKLDRLRQVAEGPARPKISDQDFLHKREDIEESIYEAVDEAFAPKKAKKDDESDESCEGSSMGTQSSSSSIPTSASTSQTFSQEDGASEARKTFPVDGLELVSGLDGTTGIVDIDNRPSSSGKPKSTMRKTLLDEEFDDCSSSDEDEPEPASSSNQISLQL